MVLEKKIFFHIFPIISLCLGVANLGPWDTVEGIYVRPNHSCETQLLNTVEDLSHRLDKRKTTDLLILDFSKAFDTVPHRRLLLKMKHYGITGKTNKWTESWLCHRQQRVVLDGTASTDSQVLSGVPQGTVLRPLLFLLYVNDIGDKISPQTTIKLFADDALLYRSINNPSDQIQLQQDLDTMIEWSKTCGRNLVLTDSLVFAIDFWMLPRYIPEHFGIFSEV